jgi:hypothetical protein
MACSLPRPGSDCWDSDEAKHDARDEPTHQLASFAPEPLEMLGEIFEEVWVLVAARFSSGDHTEAARMRLAMIILDLAADNQLSSDQIKRTAQRFTISWVPSRGLTISSSCP